MRYLSIIIIFCLVSFNVFPQKIATFKFSLILENLIAYNNFIEQINEFKKKKFEELKNEEEVLITRQKEITDLKIILSEDEYINIVSEFNEHKDDFEKKVNHLNNYLNNNIELNEKIILKEIANIVENIAIENGIDLVLFDEQYFIASDTIDISNNIYKELNNLNIALQLSEYE